MSTWILRNLALGTVMLVVGKLALFFAIPPGYATALWPPSGIALAAVLLWGRRILPAIFGSLFLINIGLGRNGPLISTLVAATIGFASTIQPAIGAFLIRRYIGFPNSLVRQRDIWFYFIFGGPVACLIAPTVATIVLTLTAAVPQSDLFNGWWIWWLGDSMGVIIFSPLVLMIFGTPREIWVRRRTTVAAPLLIAVMSITLLFAYGRSRERHRQELQFNDRCARFTEQLREQLHRCEDVMWSITRFFESSTLVTREEFDCFTRPTLARLRGIQALTWSPRVQAANLHAFERDVQNEGFPLFQVTERDTGGVMVPVRHREEYFPILYIVPFENYPRALGFDVNSEPARRQALERALIQNQAVATEPVKLVQDADGHWAVIFFVPVYRSDKPLDSLDARRESLQGYAAGMFRVDELVNDTLSATAMNTSGLAVRLVDATLPGSEREFYMGRWRYTDRDARSALTYDVTTIVAGRKWVLRLSATPEYAAQFVSWEAGMVDSVGLAFLALLGIFLLILDGRAVELEATNAKLHDAVKARDEFLSIASHELRTPLTPLKLQLQSIQRLLAKEGSPERLTKSIRLIDNQVDRLVRLVDDLLDTSRISVGRLVLEKQLVDLRQLVSDVLERHAKELRTASMSVTLDAPKSVVGFFDRLRMEQVVTNLVTNALKYAPGNPLQISIFATDDHVTLAVQDAGPGIAKANLWRIFGRFEQATIPGQQRGLGLGLFIVQQIVQAHGGTIRAESEPGRGAKFIIEMPLSKSRPAS